jgi:DNA-binding SARP family transcriptional activator/Flp pilus assembly protein TadD
MRVEFRMLGPLTVLQSGRPLDLPVSRKARALLAYLLLAPRGVSRTRLCDLLFEGAIDPRGELRWCLSKLRGILGERIESRDGAVHLSVSGCFVDAREVERLSSSTVDSLEPRRARELLELFRGVFLEALQLEGCPEFMSWLLTQRRHFHALQVGLLERLADGAPDADALGYLEKWLELAPLDIRAHERLLAVLARGSRMREGEEHVSVASRLFDAEGLDSSPLRKAWRAATAPRTRAVASKPTSASEAQSNEYCLQGQQYLARMMKHGLDGGREMFLRAIELNPANSAAWAGLGVVQAWLYEWFGADGLRLASAESTSRRALELDPGLAQAHVARGMACSLSRRYEEAIGEFEAALRIDPYSFDGHYFYARTAFARGDLKRAAELFHLAAEVRPSDFQSPILLGTAARALGREREARDAIQRGILRAEQTLARDPLDGRALSLGAGALSEDGQTERALKWAQRTLQLYPDDTSALVNVACVYAGSNQVSDALDLLERVFAQGCGKRDWIEHDPDYRVLHPEPRFHRLLSKLS